MDFNIIKILSVPFNKVCPPGPFLVPESLGIFVEIIFTHLDSCSKKRVRDFLILLPFLCYSHFFDDYKIFAILLSQLLVIHKIYRNRTKPNTFLKQKSSVMRSR